MTVEPMLKRPISAPRAKRAPTPASITRGWAFRARRRIDLAREYRLDAADEQRADQHEAHRALVGVEIADHALVACEEFGHGARGRRIHAEQVTRDIAG